MAADKTKFPNMRCNTTVTIASGSKTSSAVNLYGTQLFAIQTPAALTGTTLTAYASADGTTYAPVVNEWGNSGVMDVAASQFVIVDPDEWRGIQWFKMVSSSAEAAARSITAVSLP